ncbi:MAG: TetR/AcrR family transcriptional regulator [Oligoflexia bacterium]|nr:TetR/AcrR family transcriptional regulator [Oligoflexia bacterium]
MSNRNYRNPLETRKNILDVAFLEIYHHGFKGTSTNTIIEKMKLTRGAFFYHFPTKEDLGYALVDEVLKNMILDRWIQPISIFKNPIHGILKNYAKLIEAQEDAHILCGCPLNNLVQEMADQPGFQKRIQAIMELWVQETKKILEKAKREGFLKKEIDLKHLAEFIVACQESSYSMGKALNSRNAMKTPHKALSQYIDFLNQ